MATRASFLALPLLLMLVSDAAAEQMRGVIASVDMAKKELVLEGRGIGKRGKSFTFTLGKDVKVQWGDDAGVDDLQPGLNVQVVFTTKDGAQVATAVHIHGRRPTAPAPVPVPPGKAGDTVTGLLRRVAFTEREIVVATPGPNGKETYTTLPVADDAKITRNGKYIAYDDLKEEERVAVKTEVRKDKKVAVAIAMGAGAEPAPAGPSKIARIRTALKIADAILEMIEQRQREKEKP